jgi:hypothetical protein
VNGKLREPQVDLDNYVHLIERAECALILARGAGDAWKREALEDIADAYGRLAREAKERAKKGQAAAALGFRARDIPIVPMACIPLDTPFLS